MEKNVQAMLGSIAEDVGVSLATKATAIAGVPMNYLVMLMPAALDETPGAGNFLAMGSDIPRDLLPGALEFFLQVLLAALNEDDDRASMEKLERPREH